MFPYVENHNFYVEHWAHSVVWRKMRDLGRVLVAAEFFADADDVFLLSRHEVSEVLFDLLPRLGGRRAVARAEVLAAARWPRRNGDHERAAAVVAAAGAGRAARGHHRAVHGHALGHHLRTASGSGSAGREADGGLTGFAASPGVAEGPARVILSADGIGDLRDGEVLVAPLTAPSWAPVFGKIAATVTDVGGIMSHAAIVCREYGLPAVTGTAFGTKNIKTGQRVRVDGNAGTVTVID